MKIYDNEMRKIIAEEIIAKQARSGQQLNEITGFEIAAIVVGISALGGAIYAGTRPGENPTAMLDEMPVGVALAVTGTGRGATGALVSAVEEAAKQIRRAGGVPPTVDGLSESAAITKARELWGAMKGGWTDGEFGLFGMGTDKSQIEGVFHSLSSMYEVSQVAQAYAKHAGPSWGSGTTLAGSPGHAGDLQSEMSQGDMQTYVVQPIEGLPVVIVDGESWSKWGSAEGDPTVELSAYLREKVVAAKGEKSPEEVTQARETQAKVDASEKPIKDLERLIGITSPDGLFDDNDARLLAWNIREYNTPEVASEAILAINNDKKEFFADQGYAEIWNNTWLGIYNWLSAAKSASVAALEENVKKLDEIIIHLVKESLVGVDLPLSAADKELHTSQRWAAVGGRPGAQAPREVAAAPDETVKLIQKAIQREQTGIWDDEEYWAWVFALQTWSNMMKGSQWPVTMQQITTNWDDQGRMTAADLTSSQGHRSSTFSAGYDGMLDFTKYMVDLKNMWHTGWRSKGLVDTDVKSLSKVFSVPGLNGTWTVVGHESSPGFSEPLMKQLGEIFVKSAKGFGTVVLTKKNAEGTKFLMKQFNAEGRESKDVIDKAELKSMKDELQGILANSAIPVGGVLKVQISPNE